MSETEQKDTRKLRPAQVAASTLAATTGAFLAAQLGVYGTVIGVGVMSLLSTIGTELYMRSLERTKRAALLAARERAAKKSPGRKPPAADGTSANGAADTTAADDEASAVPDDADPADAKSRSRWRAGKVRWSIVAVGAAISFVLAMLIVTGIETVSGSSLSGGERSTVGSILGGDTGSDEQAPRREPDDQAPTPDDERPEEGTDPTEPEAPAPDEDTEEPPETLEPPAEDASPSPEDEDDETVPPPDEEGTDPDTPEQGEGQGSGSDGDAGL